MNEREQLATSKAYTSKRFVVRGDFGAMALGEHFGQVFGVVVGIVVGLLLFGAVYGRSQSNDQPYKHLGVFTEVLSRIKSEYVEERSNARDNYFFFAYTVTITNVGSRPAQLISRVWIITDAHGDEERPVGWPQGIDALQRVTHRAPRRVQSWPRAGAAPRCASSAPASAASRG